MKAPTLSHHSALRSTALALLGALALPTITEAKPKHGDRGRSHHHGRSDYRDHGGRDVYVRSPRSSFTLSLGTGYAGRGYYYGPPRSAYYYQSPGVVYYRTREAVPRAYWSSPGYAASPGYSRAGYGYSDAARCQAALSRRGYYRGPIDGDIGPGSREAIRRYQYRNGLTVTGYVNRSLMVSLGL